MGLSVSHGCWDGGYMGFKNWRNKLAEVAGFPPLQMMEGFYRQDEWFGTRELSFTGRQALALLPIKWGALRDDPLIPLLNHSDSDGSIAWQDCGPLADRLEELISKLPEGDGPGHVRNWHQTTRNFVEGLREAASLKEDVAFE